MYIIKLERSCNATEESYCNIFRSKSAKVEVLSELGGEFHNNNQYRTFWICVEFLKRHFPHTIPPSPGYLMNTDELIGGENTHLVTSWYGNQRKALS